MPHVWDERQPSDPEVDSLPELGSHSPPMLPQHDLDARKLGRFSITATGAQALRIAELEDENSELLRTIARMEESHSYALADEWDAGYQSGREYEEN